jgi:dTDP-4-amino-4,6-dideoxygalactose transaminase
MKIIQAPRASAILYNVLVAQGGIKPWLLPANICPIVPIIFMKAQVPFEFVDISASTLHMDLERVDEYVRTHKFGGILYAHTYGEPSTPHWAFQSFKHTDPDLLIVDDRCLCAPEFEIVSSADLVLFSTGYAKVVELNFGGYAFLKDELEYKTTRLSFNAKHYDELERQYKEAVLHHVRFSYHDNDWLDTDTSVPAWYDYRRQIEKKKEASLGQRAMLNEIYQSCLPKEIQLPENYQNWRFNIRLRNRDHVLDAIFKAGLFASSHYASLAGIMADGETPYANALAKEVINLFNDDHFDVDKAKQICTVVLENL